MIRNLHKREYNESIRIENKEEMFNVHFYRISKIEEKKRLFSLFCLLRAHLNEALNNKRNLGRCTCF